MTSLLSLEEFRKVIGMNPWHYWELEADVGVAEVTSNCNDIVSKYSFQSTDAVGRNDIEQAIETAEARLFELLNFWPAPKYSEKTISFPTLSDPRFSLHGFVGSDGRWQSVNVGEGYIQSVGVETRTLIQAGVVLTYLDLDNDGLNETFRLSVPTTVTDPTQIALYFSTADRWDGSAVGEQWRVRPVTVTISAGTATIQGNSWLSVLPVLYEGVLAENGLEILDANGAFNTANFAATLDVYRLFIDPTGTTIDTAQEMLIWETAPWPYYCVCNSTTNSTDPAAQGYATGRGAIRDSKLGIITVARSVYNSVTGIWGGVCWPGDCRSPDRVTLRFQAGKPLVSQQMEYKMQVLVARLAAAELTRPICACDAANRNLATWQFDLARTGGAGDESYGAISPEDLNNPLGSRRGQVYAWKEIKQTMLVQGMVTI